MAQAHFVAGDLPTGEQWLFQKAPEAGARARMARLGGFNGPF